MHHDSTYRIFRRKSSNFSFTNEIQSEKNRIPSTRDKNTVLIKKWQAEKVAEGQQDRFKSVKRSNRKRNIKRSINSRHFSPSFLSLSLFLSRGFFYRSLVRKTRFDRRDKKRTQLKRNRKNREEGGVTRFRSRANRKKNFERNTELRKISMFFLFSLIRINRIIRAKTMK